MLSAIAVAAALAAAGGAAHAQDAPATADEVVVAEEEIVVTGEQIDTYDVLPDRPTDSVFGTERTLAETPRSVTLIESPLIDLYGIRTVNDFVNMTAGTFTGNYFGVAGALDVRGERADNFFRGFRRIENRGNFPTSVAASAYVEVIKGPPPVVYGGGKVGGVLNFVPKSAKSKDAQYIGRVVGGASITLGTYGKRLGTAEFGTPFSIGDMPSGVHIFAQVEDSDHFYHDIYTKNELIQVAGNTEVGSGLSLEYGGMYQDADLNQSLGWNRVTQELIDTEGGRYLSGRPALNLDTNGDGQLSPSEVGPYQLEQFAFANPFPYGALSPMQQAAYALDPASVHYTSIDHRTVQVEKSDFSRSEVITGYLDLIYTPSDVFTIKNQTFYDDIDHLKFSSYGFTAAYDQWVFENKTTMNLKLQPVSALKLEVVGGVSWRKSVGLERESRGRGFQVLDRRDISVGATANDRFEGAHSGTGNVPYNWQEDGQHTDLGVFGVIDATIAERVTLILGGRTDYYKVSVVGTDVFGVYGSAAASDTAFSYNGSLSVEPVDDIHLYTTYAKSQYVELGQGGVIAYENVAGDTWLQDSKLWEVGLKGYLNHGRLFFNLVRYEQEKSSFNTLSGTFDNYKSHGVELEARYAMTKTLSFTGSATWQKTELQNAPFFLGIPPSVLGLDPAKVYGGRFVGIGSLIGFDGPIEAPTPDQVYSLNGTYTNPGGWGISLGATHVSSMFAGYAKAIELPAYTVTRAAAFVELGKFELRVNANNLFNAKYYTPQFLFWDVFISPSVGRTVEATISFKW